MTTDGVGYVFPDDWNPRGDTYCFRVYVPRKLQYLAAFWGAYEFFGTWIAWVRDPLKRGKDVAGVWRSAIAQARLEFEASGGECMTAIVGIRSNPLNKCEVQIQLDGSTEWIHGFNIGDCAEVGQQNSGALRFNGSTLQQYDPCTGEWNDVGPTADPRYDTPAPGKYAGVDCGNGVAGANIARIIEDSKNTMCARIGSAVNFSQLLLELIDASAAFFGFWFAEPFTVFLTGAWSYLGVHYTDVAAYDLYEALSPVLPLYISPDGSITRINFDAMLAAVVTLRDSFATLTPENSALGYATSWIEAAGVVGITNASKGGNIDTFDCGSVGWRHFFDFRVSDGGFTKDNRVPPGTGVWVSGQGWTTNVHIPSDHNQYNQILVFRDFAPTTITNIDLAYSNVNGVMTGGVSSHLSVYSGDLSGSTLLIEDRPAIETPDGHLLWAGSSSMTGIMFELLDGFAPDTDPAPGGEGILITLEVRGTGSDPFA